MTYNVIHLTYYLLSNDHMKMYINFLKVINTHIIKHEVNIVNQITTHSTTLLHFSPITPYIHHFSKFTPYC